MSLHDTHLSYTSIDIIGFRTLWKGENIPPKEKSSEKGVVISHVCPLPPGRSRGGPVCPLHTSLDLRACKSLNVSFQDNLEIIHKNEVSTSKSMFRSL